MSEPIKVGDLVVVVKPTPCGHGRIGVVFRVTGFSRTLETFWCSQCKHRWSAGRSGVRGYLHYEHDPRRLKRIPPLGELEGEKRREEVIPLIANSDIMRLSQMAINAYGPDHNEVINPEQKDLFSAGVKSAGAATEAKSCVPMGHAVGFGKTKEQAKARLIEAENDN